MNKSVWIKKPIHGARGEGIELIFNLTDFKKKALAAKPKVNLNTAG